jgi:hypothetical protein
MPSVAAPQTGAARHPPFWPGRTYRSSPAGCGSKVSHVLEIWCSGVEETANWVIAIRLSAALHSDRLFPQQNG